MQHQFENCQVIANKEKEFYLTAHFSPFLDQWLGKALNTGLFDYVWIQFYKIPQYEFNSGSPDNFKNSWNQWTSLVPGKKVYIGLPASKATAGDGYIPKQQLIPQVLPFADEIQRIQEMFFLYIDDCIQCTISYIYKLLRKKNTKLSNRLIHVSIPN